MQGALPRRAFVVGGHITRFLGSRHPDFIYKKHPDFGVRSNPSLEDYIAEAVSGTLANVDASVVDKCFIGNFVGELFSSQGHLGAAVIGSHPSLMYKPSMRVEGACASGGLAFACALDSIQAGSDVALVVGAEVQTTAPARTGGDYLARASHYARERALDDFVFPAVFARRTKGGPPPDPSPARVHCGARSAERRRRAAALAAYTEAYGLAPEVLGQLSAKAYANANLNPLAHMHHVTMDADAASYESPTNPCFLGNEEFRPFMKMSDCSQVGLASRPSPRASRAPPARCVPPVPRRRPTPWACRGVLIRSSRASYVAGL